MTSIEQFIKYHNLSRSHWPEILREYREGLNGQAWDMKSLSKFLNWDFIKANPRGLNGQAWNMKSLSKNKNLDFSFVKANPQGLN